jgi:hypothetical protein
MKGLDYAIDKFNNGDIDFIEKFFVSIEKFVDFIGKNNRLFELRPDPYELYSSDYNSMMKHIIDSSTLEQKKIIVTSIIRGYLTDVVKIDDDTYRYRFDREDLSQYFKDYSRDTSPRDVVKMVFSHNSWEPFDSSWYKKYELVEELNADTLNYVIGYIVSTYKTLDLSDFETGLSEELKERFGSPIITLTPEITKEILDDDELTTELFNSEWEGLFWELSTAHFNAYNDAYTNKIYNEVFSELRGLFGSDIKWNDGPDKGRYDSYVDLSFNTIYNFLYDFLSYGDDETYNDKGNLEAILKELLDNKYDWLDFRIPDHPDYSDSMKLYNEYIENYI